MSTFPNFKPAGTPKIVKFPCPRNQGGYREFSLPSLPATTNQDKESEARRRRSNHQRSDNDF